MGKDQDHALTVNIVTVDDEFITGYGGGWNPPIPAANDNITFNKVMYRVLRNNYFIEPLDDGSARFVVEVVVLPYPPVPKAKSEKKQGSRQVARK